MTEKVLIDCDVGVDALPDSYSLTRSGVKAVTESTAMFLPQVYENIQKVLSLIRPTQSLSLREVPIAS
jgi:hypothetical protein